jgi:hypothetical protein
MWRRRVDIPAKGRILRSWSVVGKVLVEWNGAEHNGHFDGKVSVETRRSEMSLSNNQRLVAIPAAYCETNLTSTW